MTLEITFINVIKPPGNIALNLMNTPQKNAAQKHIVTTDAGK